MLRRLLFALSIAAGAALTGCYNDSGDCNLMKTPCGGGGGSAGSGGDGGGGAGGAENCDPKSADYLPSASCGTFISPSGDDTTGDGSPAAPYATFAKALSVNAVIIYACDGTYTESVVADGPLGVQGGLDCANGWALLPSGRSVIEGDPMSTAVTVTGAVTFFRVGVISEGGVGVFLASGASFVMEDGEIDVPDQLDAPPPPMPADDPALNGENGSPGGNGALVCDAMGDGMFVGGQGGVKACVDGVDMLDVDGGLGGSGSAGATGGEGTDGTPMDVVTGQGGLGETNAVPCGFGVGGANGVAGLPGLGASGAGAFSGGAFTPPAGTAGAAGKPGQGGGGGGGANACNAVAGPGGGGGGSGGCGGQIGGAPGAPGPSAFGLLSDGASVTLTNVAITVGKGGAGGDGEDGQQGGFGGQPGLAGGGGACAGGQGGAGGRAGGGGGGIGGHSMAIGFTGTAPMQTNVTMTIGLAGLGGAAGNMDLTPTAQGGAGIACRVFDFGAVTCVTP